MNSSASIVSNALLLFFFSAAFLELSPVVGSPSFRGVSPEDLKYFKSKGDVIDCKDGSRKFSMAQLNDDFCDCPDGTDEPGTSACPVAKFYCHNVGHVPTLLFSSTVNDGICDCCDGSDEYDGKVNCSNTCWEAGKVARDKLKAKIATYKDGVLIRRQEVERANAALIQDEAELTKLKSDEKILKGLVQQLKERKEQIEKAEEEEERKRKEEEEKLKKESEKTDEQEKTDTGDGDPSQSSEAVDKPKMEHKGSDFTGNDKIGVLEESTPYENVDDIFEYGDDNDRAGSEMETEPLPKNEGHHVLGDKDELVPQVERVSGGEVQDLSDHGGEGGDDSSKPTETMSKEELGRLVASRWTGDNTKTESQEKFEEDNGHGDQSKYNHDDGYASESDDNDQKYEDEGIEDEVDDDVDDEYHPHTSSPSIYESEDESEFPESSPTWLEKIQQTVRSILQAVNLFQTPVDKSEADRVRKEYDESSAKLSKMQSRISKLTQKLDLDFGHDKEFFSFYGHCFESKQNKYTYKVCPYKKASQEEGHSTTQLGHWDKFDDTYRIMAFSNGDRCWNGPDRKMTVRLRCGLKNEVTDVDEPSRCEYVAILSTPAVCTEDKLEELQRKLALLEEQPSAHDEL